MKKIILLLFLIGVLHAGEINVALAANVSYAVDELKAEFAKSNPDTKVRVTLGSSGKLTAQIYNGAPYGIFMSANMKYPQSLYDKKIAISKPMLYAQGTLAYFSIQKQDFSKGIELLRDEKNYKIAIANPKTAPYGKAAVEAMKNAGIYEDVKSKFIFAESISQTVSYVVTAAEVGIVAKSSLYGSKMLKYKENIQWASIDASLYTPINQGIVLLKYGENSKEYKAFYDFILSDEAKFIFKKYGYIVK